MPSRPLPNDPSLEHLRKDAKRLLVSIRSGDRQALNLVKEFHPRPQRADGRFTLADAQLVVARAYGFVSWPKLKQHLAEIEPFVWNPPKVESQSKADMFLRLACLTYTEVHPSPVRARRLLDEHPELPQTSIYAAAAAGDVETVRVLLDADPALLNRKGGPLGWEPLLYACYSRFEASGPANASLETARLLLARGADPNAGFLYAGSYAFTALTGAFGRGEDWPNQPPHPECHALARLLLDAGADPNDAQALYNRHFRAEDDHLELLFEYGLGRHRGGPWIRRLNDSALNPASLLVIELCAAARHNFARRVSLLVEHGVDVNARSRRTNRTAYEEAVRSGNAAIAAYLLEHGATRIELDPLESFALACIGGDDATARAMLAADPTILDRLGAHGRLDMLHRAVERKSRDGIRLIVALGVDIDAMLPGTGFDRTVLHNAAGWGGLDIVRLLVELGADPRLRDLTYHATPLGWALYNGNVRATVEYLLQFGTIFDAVRAGAVERAAALLRDDPSLANARDEEGRPLVFSLRPDDERLEEMLQLLVAHGADLNARDGAGRSLVDLAIASGFSELADTLRARGAGGPRP